MKIDNVNNYGKIYNYNANQAVGIKNGASFDKKEDQEITISDKGREFSLAMEKLKTSPEVREDKIRDIKAQIARDTYKVDSRKLARAILLGEFNI